MGYCQLVYTHLVYHGMPENPISTTLNPNPNHTNPNPIYLGCVIRQNGQ